MSTHLAAGEELGGGGFSRGAPDRDGRRQAAPDTDGEHAPLHSPPSQGAAPLQPAEYIPGAALRDYRQHRERGCAPFQRDPRGGLQWGRRSGEGCVLVVDRQLVAQLQGQELVQAQGAGALPRRQPAGQQEVEAVGRPLLESAACPTPWRATESTSACARPPYTSRIPLSVSAALNRFRHVDGCCAAVEATLWQHARTGGVCCSRFPARC
eukprot:TRINITY_DN7666_c1_g1_i2.p2 TRINITY_DN7666_c1_g1~~TRINITY_DN7666_c1_g1_i2.p2  ORF type:complete len:210 (+),score=1.63 TRINITY_DN7666_c1_g1_i2:490-1119(+)